MVEGEELVYNVRYGFINLGQVKIKTTGKTRTAGSPAFSTIAYIDSYKGVPFVDLHAVYESLIDSAVFSRHFRGKTKENDNWNFAQYQFDYDRQRVIMEVGPQEGTVARRETVTVHGPAHDGLSLFFCARDRLYAGRTVTIPAVVAEKSANVNINFFRERSSVEIDAVDYNIDVVSFEGNADFVGIFGLTGDFEGWFSNDEARIPILAKMKVIIGSVTVELMRWNRPGWSPPRSKD